MADAVKSLDSEQADILMKYLYKYAVLKPYQTIVDHLLQGIRDWS